MNIVFLTTSNTTINDNHNDIIFIVSNVYCTNQEFLSPLFGSMKKNNK